MFYTFTLCAEGWRRSRQARFFGVMLLLRYCRGEFIRAIICNQTVLRARV